MRTEAYRLIIVDADATPVKSEIVEIAKKFGEKVLFVASYNHMTTNTYDSEWKYVDVGKESADLYIMNYSRKNDLVVTQDIGLASTLLLKGVQCIHPRGRIYSNDDMDTALDLRYLSAKERRNGKHSKGPKPFTETDRQHFITNFTKMLS